MILAISKLFWRFTRFFHEGGEESKSLFLCQPHLLIKMMSEAKIDCSSACEDIVSSALQKHYCRGCVRHYCQKLCDIYQLKFLNSFNLQLLLKI